MIALTHREHLAFEYAATRAGADPDGAFLAQIAQAYLDTHKPTQKIEVVEPETPEPPAEPTCKRGEVWLLGDHRLMCGDSTSPEDVEKLMDGETSPCVFTDPPYNAAGRGKNVAASVRDSYKRLKESAWDVAFDFTKVQDNLLAVMSKNATVYVCTSSFVASSIWAWMDTWSSYAGYVVWRKSNPMPSLQKRHWTWCTELICYATRGKHTFNFPPQGHALSVWDIAKNQVNDLHPTMKPVAVPAHAIAHSSNEGDIVVDLFGGAGSTLLACEQLKRQCRMMELEPRYVDVIIQRWEHLTGQKATRTHAEQST